MTNLSELKPGDKALLTRSTYDKRIDLEEVVVKKVYKNGLITLYEHDTKYRQNGSPVSKPGRFWNNRNQLVYWDDGLVERYKQQQENIKKARKLVELAESIMKKQSNYKLLADIIDTMPDDILTAITEKLADEVKKTVSGGEQ